MEEFLRLAASRAIKLDTLIAAEYPVEKAPEAYAFALGASGAKVATLLTYPGSEDAGAVSRSRRFESVSRRESPTRRGPHRAHRRRIVRAGHAHSQHRQDPERGAPRDRGPQRTDGRHCRQARGRIACHDGLPGDPRRSRDRCCHHRDSPQRSTPSSPSRQRRRASTCSSRSRSR